MKEGRLMAPYFLALRAVTQRNLAFFLERQDAIQVTKTNRKFYRVTKNHAKVLRKFTDVQLSTSEKHTNKEKR